MLKINNTNRVTFHQQHMMTDTISRDVHLGLSLTPKKLMPKYFYDQAGSKLFDRITMLPEYYPTRTEITLLKDFAHEFTSLIGEDSFLFELGSGSSEKIRILLEALKPKKYIPMDISGEHLRASAQRLSSDYPWLDIHATQIDYSKDWSVQNFGKGRYNAFFPGSSIGNFDPDQAILLLKRVARSVGKKGGLLIGVDLIKNTSILEKAYNDKQGVTAAFNLNVLKHIKSRLDCDIDINNFSHSAFFNRIKNRIEMHLVSDVQQELRIENKHYFLEKDETIHTENSYKYSIKSFHQLAAKAGFKPEKVWSDKESLFSIHYLQVT